jgi:hypothetical protein
VSRFSQTETSDVSAARRQSEWKPPFPGRKPVLTYHRGPNALHYAVTKYYFVSKYLLDRSLLNNLRHDITPRQHCASIRARPDTLVRISVSTAGIDVATDAWALRRRLCRQAAILARARPAPWQQFLEAQSRGDRRCAPIRRRARLVDRLRSICSEDQRIHRGCPLATTPLFVTKDLRDVPARRRAGRMRVSGRCVESHRTACLLISMVQHHYAPCAFGGQRERRPPGSWNSRPESVSLFLCRLTAFLCRLTAII